MQEKKRRFVLELAYCRLSIHYGEGRGGNILAVYERCGVANYSILHYYTAGRVAAGVQLTTHTVEQHNWSVVGAVISVLYRK